jgi:predicted PurR-regulated permease PerM
LSLYGILGGLLGVPIAAAINVVFRELYPTTSVLAVGTEAGTGPPPGLDAT